MNQDEIIAKLGKFTADPDWQLMENLVHDYLSPLNDVMSIDVKKSNDEIASEVRGRQISIEGLQKFLQKAKIINKPITTKTTTFK